MKIKKLIKISSILSLTGLVIVLFSIGLIKSQVQEIGGLAVAQSATKWNFLKDAAVGDDITYGIGAFSLYLYDGNNFDRARGDTTYGLDVDVTRMPAIVGDKTPSDSYSNPTDAIPSWSFIGIWNGSTWDRAKGTGGALNVSTTTSSSISTGQVSVGTLATIIVASNSSRRSVIIRNQGATDMYIGNSGVTTSNGLLIKAGESIFLDRNTAAIYGIVSSGSTTAGYLQE